MFNTINNNINHAPVAAFSKNVGDASQYQGNDAGGGFYRPMKKKKQDSEEKNKKQKKSQNKIDVMA